MLVTFLIMLREGLEAAIMVGIIAGYLKKTGREQWLPAVWIGVGLACVLSIITGFAINLAQAEFPQKQQELFEAVVGLIAVGILTSMVLWMSKAAKSIKVQLQRSVDQALRGDDGQGQGWALTGMAFLAVAREGLESVFFLIASAHQGSGFSAFSGGLLGLGIAVLAGYGLFSGGVRLNLSKFFRYTGVLILFVAAGLLAGALRSLHEAGVWNSLQQTAFNLSGILSVDSLAGAVLSGLLGYQDAPSVGEVLLYLIYLIPALALFLSSVTVRPGMSSASSQEA